MMDFILVPLVVGIITLGIYKLFELFVCKKERIIMIEKLGDKFNMGDISGKFSFNVNYDWYWVRFANCFFHLQLCFP